MGSEENEMCKGYLILKPEKATLKDLCKSILPSGSNNIKNLIDCPDGKEQSYTSFTSRFNISTSILLLKLFVVIAAPLKILRRFRRSPQTYGSPQVRSEDWKIAKTNDTTNLNDDYDFRYYGALTMMASKLAYEKPHVVEAVVNDCWQMNLLGCHKYYNGFQKKNSTHAFMFENTARDPNVTVIAFRGTDPFDANDWMVDLNFSWYEINNVGNIHLGFLKALGLQKDEAGGFCFPKELRNSEHEFAYYTIRQTLRDIANANPDAKFIITGHSLGGALATLFVTLLAHHDESDVLEKLQAVYTYGQPRVGDKNFKRFMEENVIKRYKFKYYRFVYSWDMVARLPMDAIISKYKHFGGCVYFNCFYNGKFLTKQPNENYFTINIWLIPKYLCAWWELIRSLIITPVLKGRAHFEGFHGILLRLVGLVIPGLSAHVCPNYVSSIRWGEIKHVPDHNKLKLHPN